MSGLLGFAEEFRAPGQAVIEPDRFAAALHLQVQELAQLARVHRATVSEAPANVRLQTFMRESLQVLSSALQIAPERDRAIYWFRNSPIPEFQHRTAEQLVADHKTEAVLSYLSSIDPAGQGRARPEREGAGRALLDIHRAQIALLCQRYAVRHLALFGSALRADFDAARSDIDLAVEFAPSAERSPSSQYFDFKADLEHLLGRRVDLIELAAMPDSRLRRIIARTQVPIYAQAA